MFWSDLLAVFLLGLAGSGHCIGMCGAFGLAVSQNGAGVRSPLLARHVAYQLGKGASYAFIGVLLMLVLGWLSSEFPVLQLQQKIGWLVGGMMVLVGFFLVLERRLPLSFTRRLNGNTACQALSALWNSTSLSRNVLIGWVNGFLPCGLSLMAMLFLSRNGSIITTLAGAFVFSAGTLPSLLAVGWLGGRFGSGARRNWVRLSGVVLVLFGVLTIFRDHPMVHAWFHHLIIGAPEAHQGHHSH